MNMAVEIIKTFDQSKETYEEVLQKISASENISIETEAFAKLMDENDPLKHLKNEYIIPKMKDIPGIDLSWVKPDDESIYFCGNSLGLQPKNTSVYANQALDNWATTGIHCHRNGPFPAAWCEELLTEQMANLVGAMRNEVIVMNALTINLHLLMVSFYNPTPQRHKILMEQKPFPSDYYAVESQIRLRGFDPATSLIEMPLRPGEETLHAEDILEMIEKEGDSIAVILFAGVQYYTGQVFDIEAITKAGHKKGCFVGIDLAHAAGNIQLHLHDWEVDFACWCTYKYLNSGPGCLGAAFLHEKHSKNEFNKLSGWWGHKLSTRFAMNNVMERSDGALGYRVSNAPSLLASCIKASLDVFSKTTIKELRRKSFLLTGYLQYLLEQQYSTDINNICMKVITPRSFNERGAQLSLSFSCSLEKVYQQFNCRGVLCDVRLPSVIRIAPTPMYNTFHDVFRFVSIFKGALECVEQ